MFDKFHLSPLVVLFYRSLCSLSLWWWVSHTNSALNSPNNETMLKRMVARYPRFSGFLAYCSAIGCGCFLGFSFVANATDRLHEATIKQCEQQAWPAHQHAAHVEFCEMYLAKERN